MSECEAMEWRRSEAEQRARLLARIAAGESLASIARDLAMPSRPQVCEWLWTDPDFAVAFRAARARGTDLLAEECLEIADEAATTAVEVADKRLRIDARLKLMARWQRVAERETPVPRLDMSQLTDDQLEVLASIPIVDSDPRLAGGGGQCAAGDVDDDGQEGVASPALDAAIGDAPAVAAAHPSQPRPAVAPEAHADLRPGLARHAPARDSIAGRALPGDRTGVAGNHARAAEPASADRDADAAPARQSSQCPSVAPPPAPG